MAFNFGLLSDAALTGLSDTEKESLQKQATTQFLLGSLLSNDPSMGLRSALSVPDQYLAGQKAIAEMQQRAADRAAVSNFQTRYMPTQFNENSPQYMGPVTPDVLQQQEDLKSARARGLPFNIQSALQDVLGLPTASQGPIRETISALKPTKQASGILTNANMQPIGGLPTFDPKLGLVSTPTVQGGNVNFNVTSAPGYGKAVEQNLTYQPQPGEVPVYDRVGNLVGVQTISGSIENLLARERAKAEGGAFGIPESVFNPVTQRREFRSRADVLGLNKPPTTGGTPKAGGPNVGGTGGAFAAEPSASEKTFTETADVRFKDFSKKSIEASDTASGRKLAAQQLYDLSTRIDNNKLTGIQAGVYSYMNAIPGIGKLFEQDITDVTRMNQAIATAQLEKTAQQKGAASNLDAQVIARGYATLTDPASATRMLAAQELALADKDIARNQFVENYRGDPAKIGTAWDNSPDNKPIFEHPKFKQFLNEQVAANPTKPVLPAGFQLVQGKSGRYGIRRPDGSVMPVGQ
jgi:hypothetical protein